RVPPREDPRRHRPARRAGLRRAARRIWQRDHLLLPPPARGRASRLRLAPRAESLGEPLPRALLMASPAPQRDPARPPPPPAPRRDGPLHHDPPGPVPALVPRRRGGGGARAPEAAG